MKNGIYKLRLTLTNRYNYQKRVREATLKIELSLPKLLYGNNFDELTQDDFAPVVALLQLRLKEMGVLVFTKVLENAPVSAIHYSKNIPLTDGLTPHYIIGKIKEANIKLSLDVNQTDYRNEGYSYKWHSNSYEVAFMTKLKLWKHQLKARNVLWKETMQYSLTYFKHSKNERDLRYYEWK